MRPLYSFDCETDPFDGGTTNIKPFLWGLYSKGDGFRYFKSTKRFAEYISKIDGIFYAHNGGRFDFIYLMPYVNSGEEIRVINGRLAKAKIGKAEIRDSLCILPMALKSYKKDDIQYWKLKAEHRKKYMTEIVDYLYGDCLYLHELVSAFRKEYGSSLTLAASALKFWKKQAGVSKVKSTRYFYDTFKPYYYGGRVQAAPHGVYKGRYEVLDINSAYPYAMTHDHPWQGEYKRHTGWPSAKNLGRAFMSVKAPSVGAFPYVDKSGLDFPNDGESRLFSVTGWEIKAAIETGAIERRDIKPVDVFEFDETVNFTDYVKHFYKLKSEAEKGSLEYIFAKLLMNSLYGKLSASPHRYKKFVIADGWKLSEWERKGWEYADSIGKRALVTRPLYESEQTYYNVATGASITGFVRAHLFKAIHASKGFLYCDTDSIVCKSSTVPQGSALGQWDLEGIATSVAVGGKKLYAMRGDFGDKKTKIASKGVRLNYADIVKIARGKTVRYKSESPTGSFRRGFSYLERTVKATS